MEKNRSNKIMVLDFWKRVIGQREISIAAQFISETYVQHSASVRDGKNGLLESLEHLKKMPKPETPATPVMFVMADQDYVALYMAFEMSGKKIAVLDMLRIENGLFAEHWDAVQNILEDPDMKNLIAPPTDETFDNVKVGQNKAKVQRYVQCCLIDQQHDKIEEFVSAGLVEHSVDCGVRAMCLTRDCSIERVYRVIGEGGVVLVQSEGTILHKSCVFYDIYRMSENKIIEHWNVHQLIPIKMPHNNGML